MHAFHLKSNLRSRGLLKVGMLVSVLGSLLVNSLIADKHHQIIHNEALLPTPPTLAQRVYAVEGTPSIIRFNNVIYAPVENSLLFNVESPVGAQYDGYYLWHPKKEEQSKPFTLNIHSGTDFSLLAELKSELVVSSVDANTSGTTIRWIAIGDSLTAPGFYIDGTLKTLEKLMPGVQVEPVGTTEGKGKPGIRHEGRGGWTWKRYLQEHTGNPQRISPFVFVENGQNVFDFTRYLREQHSGKAPEVITIFLGANDVFGPSAQFDQGRVREALAAAVSMVEQIRKAAPDAAIGILPPPPPSIQSGFGQNYRNGVTEWQYRRMMQFYIAELLNEFDGRWDEKIYIVPGYLAFDHTTAYPMASQRAQNALHPTEAGFKAISDSLSAWFVYLVSSGAVRSN